MLCCPILLTRWLAYFLPLRIVMANFALARSFGQKNLAKEASCPRQRLRQVAVNLLLGHGPAVHGRYLALGIDEEGRG